VANQKQKFAKEEDYLDAVIVRAHQMNDQTQQYNASLRDEVNALDRTTASLVQQYNQKAAAKVALQKEEKRLAAKISEAQGQLQKVGRELEIQRRVLTQERGQAPDRLKKLQTQVTELERNKAELEQQINRLASIKTRVAV
jgi:chromosome segregation ATPase